MVETKRLIIRKFKVEDAQQLLILLAKTIGIYQGDKENVFRKRKTTCKDTGNIERS